MATSSSKNFEPDVAEYIEGLLSVVAWSCELGMT